MAIFPINYCHKSDAASRQIGLTLIEVLIALAIISIAMTAIIKAASQNIRATNYLETKTMAMWVGENVLNEIRANVLVLPKTDKLNETTTLLGQEWYWQANQEETPNKQIEKIIVKVFATKEKITPVMTLESYRHHENQ